MANALTSIELATDREPDATGFRLIALAILEDCLDRRGIKQEFRQCDDEVIEDILQEWQDIMKYAFAGAPPCPSD